uniref:Mid MW proline-rich protein n=1 Tax=Euperipatoides rowelli TaxID=49087 RepID=D9IX71_EUPRO|nr:mid MW proline-rich protein [Euperipatoides rowelli]
MKVLTLLLPLLALVYSDDQLVDEGTIEDPSKLPPGYVLQPDGSYLMTIIEPGQETQEVQNQEQVHNEVIVQTEDQVQNEDDYSDYTYSNNILVVGDGDNKGVFKVSRGDSNNENDFSVEPVQSEDNPTPLSSVNKDDPQVYQEGTQGQDDYKVTLGVGKGKDRGYLQMMPDSSKPSGYKFVTQYISSYTIIPGDVQPNAEEPTEPDEEEIEVPDSPDIKQKKGYSVITVGRPGCRRYVKLTPSKNNKPHDFDLKPIKHPDQPDSSPDEDDDDAPEIIPNGERGTPTYQPIIASGPSANRRYISVAQDPKQPKRFRLVPAPPVSTDNEATEPNDDDVEYEDVPENPQYTTVKVPGNKIPVGIVSLGHPKHRVHFKIVRRSNKPGDVQVEPIRDPHNLNSSPDLNNEYAPDVCQQGDPSDENNAPIIATGPRFRRRYHKLLILRKGLRLIPVKRKRIAGTRKYKYILKKRRWHYRKIHKKIRKIIIHTKVTERRRPHGFFWWSVWWYIWW